MQIINKATEIPAIETNRQYDLNYYMDFLKHTQDNFSTRATLHDVNITFPPRHNILTLKYNYLPN